MDNVLLSFGLFSVQSIILLSRNARITLSLTYTLTSKTASKYNKANFIEPPLRHYFFIIHSCLFCFPFQMMLFAVASVASGFDAMT